MTNATPNGPFISDDKLRAVWHFLAAEYASCVRRVRNSADAEREEARHALKLLADALIGGTGCGVSMAAIDAAVAVAAADADDTDCDDGEDRKSVV